MMKKFNSTILISFIITILFLTIGCATQTNQNNSDDSQNKVNTQEKVNENKDNDNSQAEQDDQGNDKNSTTTSDTPETTNNEEQTQIKYYVNDNYFIKPIDEDQSSKVVLLTFDDSPQGDYTNEILDILDKHSAKAIFFVNGHYAVKNKELLKEIYDRGHIIGNHTWWHENLKKIDNEKTDKEIIDVNNLVEEVTGHRPVYFRPPFGVMSPYAEEVVAKEKMQRMNWSLGSLDWEYYKPELKDKVIEQVVNNITSGANILMHDKEVTSLALDGMLTKLEEEGYTFVLPSEVHVKKGIIQ